MCNIKLLFLLSIASQNILQIIERVKEHSLNVSRVGQEDEVNPEQILSVRSRKVSRRSTHGQVEDDIDHLERNPKKELLERFQQSSDASIVEEEALNASDNVEEREESVPEPPAIDPESHVADGSRNIQDKVCSSLIQNYPLVKGRGIVTNTFAKPNKK